MTENTGSKPRSTVRHSIDASRAAHQAVAKIFEDLRDRRFLKWLFADEGGRSVPICTFSDGEKLMPLDGAVQGEIAQSWTRIVDRAWNDIVGSDEPMPPELRPLAIETAPRDGTMISLLIDFEGCERWSPMADEMQSWTVGFNHFDDTGEDEWIFVGWEWNQDCIVDRRAPTDGRILGWLPVAGTATSASDQHPDDEAVDRWAVAMKAKLAAARAKGRGGWDDPMRCSPEQLTSLLRDHVEKGDPLDVAIFAMMIHQRGLRILPPTRWADDCIAHSVEALKRHENDELDQIPNWLEYMESVHAVLGELQNRLRQDIRRPDRVRHQKTGGTYEVLGVAQIQTSPDQPLADMDRVVLYRSTYRGDRPYVGGELRGDLWARRETEFNDGRFEPVEGEAL